ncbi:MAG: hypothetical protein K8S94_08855 [Planctomycetia bacterium]|nr:hypothetical protein [Planctomycetia bacterium]
MNIGLLGSDIRMAEIVAAAIRRRDRVVAAWGIDDPHLPRVGSWESLLDPAACDLVFVGSDDWDASRAEAVRTLVQAGRPLVLAQPLEFSMLWAYELDMIRRDTGSLLIPCLPDRLHPFVGRLRETIAAALAGVGDHGPAESLLLERRMADRSRSAVLAQLSRDADLIRTIVGDPTKLSTLGSASPDSAWNTLAVGFTGPTQLPVRWQVAPAGDPGLTLRLQAARGVVVVDAPDDAARPWTWSGTTNDAAMFDRGAAMLGVIDRSLAGKAAAEDGTEAATWADAARAIELAETVPRSLARGRAIDLHREEFSEMGTFRGTMASLGCGLIMAALMVVVVATLLAGIAQEFGWKIVGSVADSWPAIVLVVLGLFLVLQLIPLLVAGGRDGGGPSAPNGET